MGTGKIGDLQFHKSFAERLQGHVCQRKDAAKGAQKEALGSRDPLASFQRASGEALTRRFLSPLARECLSGCSHVPVAVDQLLVIQPEHVQHRRMQVVMVHLVLDGPCSVLVRCTKVANSRAYLTPARWHISCTRTGWIPAP